MDFQWVSTLSNHPIRQANVKEQLQVKIFQVASNISIVQCNLHCNKSLMAQKKNTKLKECIYNNIKDVEWE